MKIIQTVADNNKRIAKNTLFLYTRMLLVMFVGLFSVRIILDALGAEDYGIYNVVGGVVSMFTVLVTTVTTASTRFFSYELGRKDYKKLSDYFSTTFWCYVVMGAIILLLSETIGLWFVKSQLTIPVSRLNVAIWVYQCAIISFLLNILSIPFNALIVARERMKVYAYIGILDGILKLCLAFLLLVIVGDKLKWYAILVLLGSFIVSICYVLYGLSKFPESRVKRFWSIDMFKEVFSYSAWVLFGAVSGICRNQGINILLNIFFGPIVNAAIGIASSVRGAISGFVTNFFQAVNPQIIKYYAFNQKDEMLNLAFRTSRFCFYLMLLLSLPVLLETPFLLNLWLKKVPDATILFTRLVIINAMVDSVNYALMGVISATGKIKVYQIILGSLLILNLPISWLCFKLGCPSEATLYIAIILTLCAVMARVIFANRLAGLSIRKYISDVFWIIIKTTVLSCIVPVLLKIKMGGGWEGFLIVFIVSIISSCLSICFIGINKSERVMLFRSVVNKFHYKQ